MSLSFRQVLPCVPPQIWRIFLRISGIATVGWGLHVLAMRAETSRKHPESGAPNVSKLQGNSLNSFRPIFNDQTTIKSLLSRMFCGKTRCEKTFKHKKNILCSGHLATALRHFICLENPKIWCLANYVRLGGGNDEKIDRKSWKFFPWNIQGILHIDHIVPWIKSRIMAIHISWMIGPVALLYLF